jgi:hypothetical protein
MWAGTDCSSLANAGAGRRPRCSSLCHKGIEGGLGEHRVVEQRAQIEDLVGDPDTDARRVEVAGHRENGVREFAMVEPLRHAITATSNARLAKD